MFFSTVGGIYTVLRSKAGVTTDELGDQYCMLGPYNEATVRTEVEVCEPENEVIRRAIKKMTDQGLKVESIELCQLVQKEFSFTTRD